MPGKKHLLFQIWKTFVLLCIFFVAITVPIELSFQHKPLSIKNADWLIAIIFFFDFLLNIKRIRIEKKNKECKELETQKWYQNTVIFSDLIAALPLDLFFPLPLFKLFRLFKLVRLHHILVLFQHNMIQFAASFTLLSYTFWMALALNALSCGWHALQLNHSHSHFASDYINSLYWTITTVTTVGYGDVTPVSNAQKLYAIFVQLLGYGVFTFIIGTIASRLMRKDPARERFEDNVDGLVSLMHFKSLPSQLRNQVMDYYKYMWRNRLGYDETLFLESLPENLQTEVALHLKGEIIDKVSIFKGANDTFKKEIALLLKPLFVTPNDYLFKAGDKADCMYFVVNGKLNTLSEAEDCILTELKDGDYFGEIALLKNKPRSATIKATAYCDLYALDKESFQKVYKKYPDIGHSIQATVEEREKNYAG